MSNADLLQIHEAAGKIGPLPIHIEEASGLTVSQIASIARLNRRRADVGLIVVDYLQLILPADKRAPREQQVAGISRELKLMAQSLGVPVLCLAQLNRSIETRENKRPRLSDLRESGAIEQDADMVWFLDRPSIYDPDAETTKARLHIEKHRSGMTGVVDLFWDAATMTFRSAAKEVCDAF